MCTHSIIFEPIETRRSIVKFKFGAMTKRPATAVSAEGGIFATSIADFVDRSKTFAFEVDKVVHMKTNNENRPWILKKCGEGKDEAESLHLFVLVHTSLDTFLPKVNELIRLSTNEKELLRNIERRQVADFDVSNLTDYMERVLLDGAILVSRVSPLIDNPGCLQVTDANVYFQPAPVNNVQKESVTCFPLTGIKRMYKRRYMLRQCGLELLMQDGSSVFFAFRDTADRDRVFNIVQSQPSLTAIERCDPMYMREMTRKWQAREIDNFTYLMHLNSVADRSLNDLTQYPVMPWVLRDYKSATLDLGDPSVYRDLSKPIGALNPKRLVNYRARYEQMPTGPGCPPKFMYGTHYSTPGYVLNYLVRVKPEYMLCLQNGRFDHADRIFADVAASWRSVMTNPADVKELIPEFYEGSGEFLTNAQRLELGTRQSGERVDDVVLPPWASSPKDFVRKCREALESDVVSANLHKWIDLIFGYKQRGKEAERADNVFYYITYEGAVDVDSITDLVERKSIALQIREFGQTPKQVFVKPHPPRTALGETGTRSSPPPSYAESTKRAAGRVATVVSNDSIERALSQHVRIRPRRFDAHKQSVTSVCVSSDGRRLLSTSEDAGLGFVDDASAATKLNVCRGISKLALSSCTWTDIPRTAIASSWDGSLYLWSSDSRSTLHEIVAHEDAVSCVAYANGRALSGSWDSLVKLWDVEASIGGRADAGVTIGEHDTEVSCVSMSPNLLAISGSCDGQLFVRDLRTKPVRTVSMSDIGIASVMAAHVMFDERSFVACGADGIVRRIAVDTGKTIAQVDTGDEDVSCACRCGDLLLTGSSAGIVRAWAFDNGGAIVQKFRFGGGADRSLPPLTSIASAAGGGVIYVGCESGETFMWRSG